MLGIMSPLVDLVLFFGRVWGENLDPDWQRFEFGDDMYIQGALPPRAGVWTECNSQFQSMEEGSNISPPPQ